MLPHRQSLLLLGCLLGAPLTACLPEADPAPVPPSVEALDEASGPAVAAASSAPLPGAAALTRDEAAAVLGSPASLTLDPKADKARRAAEFSTESQCGATWDAQQVEQYNGALGTPTSFVARHEVRVGYHVDVGCSGTLISDDLFLSAGHCGYAVGHTVRFDYQNAPNGSPRTPRDFLVTQVVEQENNAAWDYAIVRLGGSPGREFGHASIAAIDPPVFSPITIIGHPSNRPKEIHTGPLFDYNSLEGTNWFRHQVDTEGGSSGSGVLNADGQLIGVHTNAGCFSFNPVNGNSAMRMSQLVPHSPTLQTLTRSRVLWRHNSGQVTLWNVDAAGALLGSTGFNPGPSWFPASYSNNSMMWRNVDARISYWTLNSSDQNLTYFESTPAAGWRAINHASGRVLWWNAGASLISLWTVNQSGQHQSHVDHAVAAGWTPVNYANNHILWRHTSGQVSLWRLSDAGAYLGATVHGPFAGWTALSYDNGEILWRHTDGRSSLWTVNRAGAQLSSHDTAAVDGWTVIAGADRKMIWRHNTGLVVLRTISSHGSLLVDTLHQVSLDWLPLLTSGARP